jgi:ribosomal protein L23
LDEERFRDIIYKEKMRMNKTEIDNLITHFFDIKSNKVNINLLMKFVELRVPLSSNNARGGLKESNVERDLDGRSTK